MSLPEGRGTGGQVFVHPSHTLYRVRDFGSLIHATTQGSQSRDATVRCCAGTCSRQWCDTLRVPEGQKCHGTTMGGRMAGRVCITDLYTCETNTLPREDFNTFDVLWGKVDHHRPEYMLDQHTPFRMVRTKLL